MSSDRFVDEDSALAALRECEARLHAMQQISQISHLLSAEPELDKVLDEIGRRTAQLMECERASLFIVADDGRTLSARIVGDDAFVVELRMGQGIAGWVAEHGRAVNVKDAYRDPRFVAHIDQATGFRTRSILCQPLRDRHERPLGVLQVLNKRGGDYFTTHDEVLLETIAAQAAGVIRSSRLLADLAHKHHALLDTQVRLQERNSEMDLMFQIERAAAVARGLDEALDGALAATLSEYPCDAAAVLLLEDDGAPEVGRERRWRVRRAAGEHGRLLAHAVGRAGEPLIDEALCAARAVVLFDDPVLPARPPLLAPFARVETIAVIPLQWRERNDDDETTGDTTLGALVMVNSRRFPKGFDDLDLHKLGVIASRMALSVRLAGAMEADRNAERMAAIGGALSGIVHDLRTPLTLLDGYARLLCREADADERGALRVKHKQQIEVVNGMIQDVLAFARGQSQVLPRKVFVRDFVQALDEMLRVEVEHVPVRLSVVAEAKGAMRIDEGKMKRVVTNLARNAIEAMGAAGGELEVRVSDDAQRPGRVVLSVRDTGPGIPPEMEGRLFREFASHGKTNGTGLGLAIVKQIVDQHEGTLEVVSAPGRGTTFVVGLPGA